jgi:hypothetical protein
VDVIVVVDDASGQRSTTTTTTSTSTSTWVLQLLLSALAVSRLAASPLVLGLAGTAALFHRVLLDGAVILGGDALRVSLPLYDAWAERVRHGEFPQWFPGDAFGQSFIGMVVSAPFHPSHLLSLLMPAAGAVTLSALACYPLAVAGTAALARRLGCDPSGALLAGAAYGFCGYLLSMHDNPPYLLCAATAPYALAWADTYLAEGTPKSVTLACALWALCLFAGDAQGFLATGLGVLLLAAHRRAWRRAALVIGCTALLAAPQALPAWLVSVDTSRAQLNVEQIGIWSTPPVRLLELFAGPLFFAQPGTPDGVALARQVLHLDVTSLWAGSLAVTPLATALAAVAAWHHRRARGAWLLGGAFLLAVWLALGRYSGATTVLAALPVLKGLRYPEKWMVWAALALALGAARGLERRPVPLLGALSAVAVVAIPLSGQLPAPLRDNAVVALLASAVVLGGAAVALHLEQKTAVAWLSLVAAVPGIALLQLGDPSALDVHRGLARSVPSGARVYRQMSLLEGAWGEPERLAAALVDVLDPVARGVEGAGVYLPAMTRRAWTLVDSREWLGAQLYQLGSVGYLSLSPADQRRVPPLPPVAVVPPYQVQLYADAAAVPRAYFAQPLCVHDATPPMLVTMLTDRRHQALVECEGAGEAVAADADVQLLEWAPEHRLVGVTARSSGALVVTDALARGWNATLDGVDAPLLLANTAFMAVQVPPGSHQVELRYRTPGLWPGLFAFALGVAAVIAVRRRSTR